MPFLGTCGGFQHTVIEYARNVLGLHNADHAETNPNAQALVISPLSCALVEVSETLRLTPESKLAEAYGQLEIEEGYHCNYGFNPMHAKSFFVGPMVATGHDQTGEVRAIELKGHPFFAATLFQPERRALAGQTPPLVKAFCNAISCS